MHSLRRSKIGFWRHSRQRQRQTLTDVGAKVHPYCSSKKSREALAPCVIARSLCVMNLVEYAEVLSCQAPGRMMPRQCVG